MGSESEINLRFTLDSEGVVTGIVAVGDAGYDAAKPFNQLGESAKKSATALVEGMKKVSPEMKEAQQAAKDLDVALSKIDSAGSARALGRASAETKVALDTVTEAAKKAGVSVDSLGVDSKAAEAKMNGAAAKAGAFKDAMGDMATRGNLAAQGTEALAGKMGSLEGMLGLVKDTGGEAAGKITNIGFAALGAVAGIGAAVAAGKALGEALAKMVDWQADAAEKAKLAADKTQLQTIAFNMAAKGTIAYGSSLTETVKNYERYVVASGVSTAATDKFIESLSNIKAPNNLKELKQNFADFSLALSAVMKRGDAETSAFLESQKSTIDTMVKGYATLGKQVPKELQAIVKAMEQATAAQKLLSKDGAEAAIAGFQKIKKARDDDFAHLTAIAAKTSAQFNKDRKENDDAEQSQEEWSRKKQAIWEAEVVAANKYIEESENNRKRTEEMEKELQKTLGVSDAAFQKAREASDVYNAEIASGAKPVDAMAKSQAVLSKAIEDAQTALPLLNAGLVGMGAELPKVAVATDNVSKQQAELAKSMKAAELAADQVKTAMEKAKQAVSDFGGEIAAVGQKAVNFVADLLKLKEAAANLSGGSGEGGGTPL